MITTKGLLAPDAMNPVLPALGTTDGTCPYCATTLVKRPARRTPCPVCGRPIVVRTRPYTGEKVLVTEEEADQLAVHWSIRDLFKSMDHASMERYNWHRTALSQRGTSPSHHDVMVAICCEDMADAASRERWCLYGCELRRMSGLLEEEERYEEALSAWIEAAILDINGASDMDNVSSDLRREFPPFRKDMSCMMLETMCEAYASTLTARGIDVTVLRPCFETTYQAVAARFRLIFKKEQTWNKLHRTMERALRDALLERLEESEP